MVLIQWCADEQRTKGNIRQYMYIAMEAIACHEGKLEWLDDGVLRGYSGGCADGTKPSRPTQAVDFLATVRTLRFHGGAKQKVWRHNGTMVLICETPLIPKSLAEGCHSYLSHDDQQGLHASSRVTPAHRPMDGSNE